MICRTTFTPTSGIYLITSVVNGKYYVGSGLNLKGRKGAHLRCLEKGIHGNIRLQSHINEYSLDSLSFSIIEFCPKEKLIEREQYWIDKLHPEFNILANAYSALGFKKSKESIQQSIRNTRLFYLTPEGKECERRRIESWKKWNSSPKGVKYREQQSKRLTGSFIEFNSPEAAKRCKEALGEFYKSEEGLLYKQQMSKRRKAYAKTEKGLAQAKRHSEYMSGPNGSNNGRHWSEETNQKRADSFKAFLKTEKGKLYTQNRTGINNPRYGKHPTKETLEKQSNSHKNKIPWNKGISATEERKHNQSLSMKERWKDPIFLLKMKERDIRITKLKRTKWEY